MQDLAHRRTRNFFAIIRTLSKSFGPRLFSDVGRLHKSALVLSLPVLAALASGAQAEMVDEALCSCSMDPFLQDSACTYTTICDRTDNGTVLNEGTSTIVDSKDLHCNNCPIAGDCDKETAGPKSCSWNARLSYTTQWEVNGSVSGEGNWWIAKWKVTVGGSFGKSTTLQTSAGGSVTAPACTWRHDIAEARVVTGKLFRLDVAYSWLSTEYGSSLACSAGEVVGQTICKQEGILVTFDDDTMVVEDQLIRSGNCTAKPDEL